jgi:ligand-binding sensor domain-containing protein
MKMTVVNLRKILDVSSRIVTATVVILTVSCAGAPVEDTPKAPAEQMQADGTAALTPPAPPVMPPPPPERSEAEILVETDRRADAMKPVIDQQIATVVPGEYPTIEKKVKKKKKSKRAAKAKRPEKKSYAKRTPRKTRAQAAAPVPVPVPEPTPAPEVESYTPTYQAGDEIVIPELELMERYTDASGLPSNLVSPVYVDESEAWVGTSGGGLARYVFEEDNWINIGMAEGLISNNILDIVKFKGKVYVSTKQGITVWDGFSWVTITEKERVQTQNASFTVNGDTLWVAARNMRGGVLQYDGSKWKNSSAMRPGALLNNVSDMAFEGKDIWVGTTSRGLYTKKAKKWSSHTVSKGIASNFIYTLAVKDGKAYLGGCCGLSYYDGSSWVVFDVPEGLPHSTVNDILTEGPLVWLASKNGLSAFDGEEFHNFYAEDGLLGNNHVTSIFLFRDELWVGTTGGLSRLKKFY